MCSSPYINSLPWADWDPVGFAEGRDHWLSLWWVPLTATMQILHTRCKRNQHGIKILLWKRKAPHIKIAGLEAHKTKGWLRVPDVSCYKCSFTVGSTPWNHWIISYSGTFGNVSFFQFNFIWLHQLKIQSGSVTKCGKDSCIEEYKWIHYPSRIKLILIAPHPTLKNARIKIKRQVL